MRTWFKWTIVLLVVAGLGVGVWWYFFHKSDIGQIAFKFAPAKKKTLTASIAATGTIQAEEVVDVGAQVAGRITKFGTDTKGKPIDFSSHVEKDKLLAEIDPDVYQSAVDSAKANLDQATAGVARANADVQLSQAKLDLAKRDWDRAQEIRKNGGTEALSQSQYDIYQSANESAQASLEVSKASVLQAQATAAAAKAALDKATRELGYCTINCPVDGVVIARRVNIGQTVVASLNAPSLFLIARDLKHMQVWTPVNEVDVNQVHEGQDVSFNVDGIPDREFSGKVIKARLEPTVTQNVVTYIVEIAVDNHDEVLRPYSSANVKFKTAERVDVLSVPNAALRYTPPVENMIPSVRDKYAQAAAGGAAPAAAPSTPAAGDKPAAPKHASTGPSTKPSTKPAKARGGHKTSGVVWVDAGNDLLKPVEVHVGMTDGASTEIVSGELTENTEVVIGEMPREEAAAGGTNPFAPQFPSRKSGGRPR